jgi:exopolysaccharide biosynthesis polyprenyl glycosylphosphotransferase
VIVAFSSAPDRELVTVMRTSQAMGLGLIVVPRLFDAIGDRMELDHLGGMPVFGMRPVNPNGLHFAAKHAFDRVGAALLLFLLAPLLLTLATLVKLSSPGPVLFRQRRVGRDGQPFDLLKFRSMAYPAGEEEFEPQDGAAPGGVEGADRRTPIGRLLRRTSLDELPQLLNVLMGEMSLVGPRPERPEFVALFQQEINRYGERHRVRAGMTGWAQVHGLRGQTSIADRAEWDNYYIENWSMRLDVKILLMTLLTVFRSAE